MSSVLQEKKQGYGCRLLPHGGYALLPATLSTMAWITSLAQDGCDYSHLTGPSVAALTGSDNVPYLEVGFNAYREPDYNIETGKWVVEYSGKCLEYDREITDAYWDVSKAFAYLSLVFGGGGALFIWCSSCFVFGPGTWRWAGYEVLAACIFQSLSFLWFLTAICAEEGNQCALFFGSKSDMVAAIFWLISAIAIFARYPKPAPNIASSDNFVSDIDYNSALNDNNIPWDMPSEGTPGR